MAVELEVAVSGQRVHLRDLLLEVVRIFNDLLDDNMDPRGILAFMQEALNGVLVGKRTPVASEIVLRDALSFWLEFPDTNGLIGVDVDSTSPASVTVFFAPRRDGASLLLAVFVSVALARIVGGTVINESGVADLGPAFGFEDLQHLIASRQPTTFADLAEKLW